MKKIIGLLLFVITIPLYSMYMTEVRPIESDGARLIRAIDNYSGSSDTIDFEQSANENIRTIYEIVVHKNWNACVTLNYKYVVLKNAVLRSNYAFVRFFAEHGIDLNYIPSYDSSLLSTSIIQAIETSEEPLRERAKNIVHYFLSKKVNVNALCKFSSKSNFYPFALYATVAPCSLHANAAVAYEMADLLIDHKVDIKMQNEEGNTALMKLFEYVLQGITHNNKITIEEGRTQFIFPMPANTPALADTVRKFTLLFMNAAQYPCIIPWAEQKLLEKSNASSSNGEITSVRYSYLDLLPGHLKCQIVEGSSLNLSLKNKKGETTVSLAEKLTPLLTFADEDDRNRWQKIIADMKQAMAATSSTH